MQLISALIAITCIVQAYILVRLRRRCFHANTLRIANRILNPSRTRKVHTHINAPSVRISTSPLHGNGVFALRSFKANDVVEECPILTIPRDDRYVANLYIFKDYSSPSKVMLLLGYGSLYNHSKNKANAFFQQTRQSVVFIASRDIQTGEEILINYGDDFWETQIMLKHTLDHIAQKVRSNQLLP